MVRPIFFPLLFGAALVTAATQAPAPNLDSLPTCAKNCANTAALASGCTLSDSDSACLCKTNAFSTATSGCIKSECNAGDQTTTNTILHDLCASGSSSQSSTSTTTSSTTKATPSPPITTKSSSTSTSTLTSKSTSTTKTSSSSSVTSTTSTATSSPTTLIVSTTSTSPPTSLTGTTLSVPPTSLSVVLSTSTAQPTTTNAAMGLAAPGEGAGILGALAVGLLALV